MMADDRVLAHLRANHDRIFGKLVEFASIPSVSTDPAHAADIDRAARWVAAEVTAAGPFATRVLPPGVWLVMHNQAFPIDRVRKDRQQARFVESSSA